MHNVELEGNDLLPPITTLLVKAPTLENGIQGLETSTSFSALKSSNLGSKLYEPLTIESSLLLLESHDNNKICIICKTYDLSIWIEVCELLAMIL